MNRIGIDNGSPIANGSNVLHDAKISSDNNVEILSNFKSHLTRRIRRVARKLNIEPEGDTPGEIFGNLIEDLNVKKNGIIILIDEYDYHLVQSFHLPELQDDIRKILRDFYMQVKSENDNIYFAFFTGIAKLSKIGIFSELNLLNDISIDKKYAVMYGYTQEELEKYFGGYIDSIAHENKDANVDIYKKIFEYYDGYTFDGRTHVYNPISILKFMNSGEFQTIGYKPGAKNLLRDIFTARKLTGSHLKVTTYRTKM
jgi:hypothetical protein